jgi:hypothetical protein
MSGWKAYGRGEQYALGGNSSAAGLFDFSREGKFRMNKANDLVNRIKIGLGIVVVAALASSLTGCAGYVDGGYGGGYGDYGGYDGYYDGGPDVYLFGGNYDRGRDAHAYSHRGSVSRGMAHAGGGGGHGGGGGSRR